MDETWVHGIEDEPYTVKVIYMESGLSATFVVDEVMVSCEGTTVLKIEDKFVAAIPPTVPRCIERV